MTARAVWLAFSPFAWVVMTIGLGDPLAAAVIGPAIARALVWNVWC